MKKSLCSGLNPVKLCSHEVAAKGTSTILWTSCGACENHTCLFVFAFVLSWRDSRTRPPARQDIFFKPSDGETARESQPFVEGPCGQRWTAAGRRRDRRWEAAEHLAQACTLRRWLIWLSDAGAVVAEGGGGVGGWWGCLLYVVVELMTYKGGLCDCMCVGGGVHLVGDGHTSCTT